MTDEQIIIDGCDVSKCEFYNKDDKTCREVNGNYDTDICEFDKCENSNCVYKQLKRKEQECEELKEDEKSLLNVIDDLQKTKNEWQEKYNDLGQDFDQLKRQHESDKGLITSTGKMNYQLIQEYDKIKNCLTEIKKIAEKAAKCLYATESDDYTDGYRWLGSIILQKISEVEECKP